MEKAPWNWVDWKFKNYDIKLNRYFPADLLVVNPDTKTQGPGPKVPEFTADLGKAQLLSIGPWVLDAFYQVPECRKAVDEFLARGGTILYHYNSAANNIPSVNGLGKCPQILLGKASAEVSADCKSSLLREPFDLSKLGSWEFDGFGAWGKWSKSQQTLIHKKGEPDKAFLILFEGVNGKGRIIMNRVYSLHRTVPGEKASGAIAANIMQSIWGKLERGSTVSESPTASDSSNLPAVVNTKVPVLGLNPYYFNGLRTAAWWNKDWNYRLPIIVREPMGVDRKKLVATIDCKLDAYSTNCYFIYCDDQPKPATAYRDEVSMLSKDGLITLWNKQTEVVLSAVRPEVYGIEAAGASTHNQFSHGESFERLGAGCVIRLGLEEEAGTAVVVENGPVRKAIEYSFKGKDGVSKPLVRISMDAGSRLLNCEYFKRVSNNVRWWPGNGPDSIPDAFAWPSQDGIRKIEFTTENLMVKPNEISEGWYAFTDGATGQTVGELFEARNVPKVGCVGYGLTAGLGYAVGILGSGRQALVALPDGSNVGRLRQEYLFFKNPPQVALAVAQERKDCPAASAVPVWNKNFIAMYHLGLYSNAFKTAWDGKFAAYWNEQMPKLRDHGYNGIGVFPNTWEVYKVGKYKVEGDAKPSFAAEFMDKARQHGMATYLMPPRYSGSLGEDPYGRLVLDEVIKDKKGEDGKYSITIEKVKEAIPKGDAIVAALKPTFMCLTDETTYRMRDEDKEAFRKIYGMEPIGVPKGGWLPSIDETKLAEPAQHNTVLFQINTYTDILRLMAEAARKAAPGVLLADQINPAGMIGLSYGGPHDLEAHSDFLDSVSMDLYDNHRPLYKYFNKLMLGMFDNRKAVIQIVGCTTPPEVTYASVAVSAMWGVKVFSFFPARQTSNTAATKEVQKTFAYFNNTGLGDLMATMHPARHIALLRDRDAMFDDIKNGRWGGYGSRHDNAVGNLVVTPNFQADILMTKYLTPENLKTYAILFVASDPILSEKHLKIIEAYAKAGGHVVLEGETIRSPAAQTLAGIKFGGKVEAVKKLEVKDNFSFTGNFCVVEPADTQVLLKADNGTPVLLERKLGAGTVTCIPFELGAKVGSQEDLQTFVRSLCERLAGPQLASVDKDSVKMIDSNLLEDGKGNYVFCAWNPGIAARHVIVSWKEGSRPERIVNVGAGASASFEGSFEFDLNAGSVKQFFLGIKGVFEIPEASMLTPGSMPGYSEFPGEDVMAFKPTAESKSAAVKRPAKVQGQSYVAVFTPDLQGNYKSGADAICDTLSKAKGIVTEKLSPENLEYFDAVIVPNFGGYATLPKDWLKNLREYVLNGGSALLCHRAVGYVPCEFAPLPEVGQNAQSSVNKSRDMQVAAEHPITTDLVVKKRYPDDYRNPAFQSQIDANILKVGDTFRTGFCDYIALKPGKDAQILINGADGYPSLIAGNAGKGKAVLCGMGLGQDETGKNEKMAEGDAKVLINSVYWLVEK